MVLVRLKVKLLVILNKIPLNESLSIYKFSKKTSLMGVFFLLYYISNQIKHMKNLKNYIKECIDENVNQLAVWDIDDNIEDDNKESILDEVKHFLTTHYVMSISKTFDMRNCKITLDKTINKYIVNCKYDVEVAGDHGHKDMTQLTNGMFEWGKVNGCFDCRDCVNLTSLEGAPKEVRWFQCSACPKLESLKGAPQIVKGDFDCNECGMKNLEGAPTVVKGDFCCMNCANLTSLEGAPNEVGVDFRCDRCVKLANLKGAPTIVKGGFFCEDCLGLKSLEGAPRKVGNFICSNCVNLTSLKGVPETIPANFYCDGCGMKNLEGAPKTVGRNFNCYYCPKLTSLKGAPEYVGGDFNYAECPKLESTTGIGKVKGRIIDKINKPSWL